jgi:Zn-dependent protease with chaperone function
MSSVKAFPNLQAKSFLHPNDAAALKALQAIPFLGWGLRKVNALGTEKATRLNRMANNILVTPRTCPQIYEMMVVCSKILDMPKLDVFIDQTPMVNACTEGVEHPMITVNSGLIELLTEEELLAVVAHEMGHAKCEHLLYHNLAVWAVKVGGYFGNLGTTATLTAFAALYKWQRESELSADRAALLVVQDYRVVVSLLMKLSGGSRKIASQINYDDFLEQSRAFRNIANADTWNKVVNLYNTAFQTHPFAVMRASEIVDWPQSEEYKNILNGNYIKIQEYIPCPHCKKKKPPEAIICPHCYQHADKKSETSVVMDRMKDMFLRKSSCPSCEKKIPKDSLACPYCKIDLEAFNESI